MRRYLLPTLGVLILAGCDRETLEPVVESPTHQPSFSVSGTPGGKIAFMSVRTGKRQIFTMNADGSNVTNISNRWGHDQEASWSPDGSKIVFTSPDRPDADGVMGQEVYIMNADGTEVRQLTNDNRYNTVPSWSPDGTKIIYGSERLGTPDIYIIDAEGRGDPVRLTTHPAYDVHPAWSPDGSTIAFLSERDGNAEIYLMNPDGSNQRRLTVNSTEDYSPMWSPDGSKIVVARYPLPDWEIYLIDVESGAETRLTNNSFMDINPAWSPDGSKVIFQSYRSDTYELYVMNPDGSEQTQISDVGPGTHDFFPRWIGSRNASPVADAGGPYTATEGSPISLALTGTDSDGDRLTYTWDLGDGTRGSGATPPTSHTYDDNGARNPGTYTITLTVDDGKGGTSQASAQVTVENVAPRAILRAPTSSNEGTAFSLAFSDPADAPGDLSSLTYAFDCGSGYGAFSSASFVTCPAPDDALLAIKGTVKDKDGGQTEYSRSVQVLNVSPEVGTLATRAGGVVFVDPIPVNTAVEAVASYSDPGAADTHTASVNWDVNGAGTRSGKVVSGGTASVSRTISDAGVYVLQMTVTDDDSGAGVSPLYQYLVAYDPNGGFVTGAGWSDSPSAACPVFCGGASGKATFGFVSRYVAGRSTPVGNTEFHFQAGGLKFTSESYETLVVSGNRAQYWGTGAVNGGSGYRFRLTAVDGQAVGNDGSADKFRIEIKAPSGELIYDNQWNAAQDAQLTTAIRSGNISIKR